MVPPRLGRSVSASIPLLALVCACSGGGTSETSAAAPDSGARTGDSGEAAHDLGPLRALSPDVLPPPPADVSNRFADDPGAAAFGQQIFFDSRFSGALLDSDNVGTNQTLGREGEAGKVACAGCHIPSAGFLDNRSARKTVSLGAGWTRRRARSLLDIGQARLLMWDGRHDALFNQPFESLENPVDMNSSRLFAAEQVYKYYRATYEAIFGPIPVPLDDRARFAQLDGMTTGCRRLLPDDTGALRKGSNCHGLPGDGAEFDQLSESDRTEVTRVVVNMGKALGAYERRLSCGPSRFDEWMHGQADALTASEQRGAFLFVGQREGGGRVASCDSCHSGPFFTDQEFHNVGLSPVGVGPASSFVDKNDRGAAEGLEGILADPLNVRGAFSDGDDKRLPDTVPPGAEGGFRTPALRCAAMRPSFMHTGQIGSLPEVVSFFDRGGDSDGFLGQTENVPRNFSQQERDDLAAFLEALTGPGPDNSLLTAPTLPAQ